MTASEALNHPWIREKYKMRSPVHPRYSSDRDSHHKTRYDSRSPSPIRHHKNDFSESYQDHHYAVEHSFDDYYNNEWSRTNDHYYSQWDSSKYFYPNYNHRYQPYRSKYPAHGHYNHVHHNHNYHNRHNGKFNDHRHGEDYEKDYDYHYVDKHPHRGRSSRSRNRDHPNFKPNLKRTSDEIVEPWSTNNLRQRRRRLENIAD